MTKSKSVMLAFWMLTAGFAFNLVSALIAHASIHDRHAAFAPSAITLLLGTCSYVFWRRLEDLRGSPLSAMEVQEPVHVPC